MLAIKQSAATVVDTDTATHAAVTMDISNGMRILCTPSKGTMINHFLLLLHLFLLFFCCS